MSFALLLLAFQAGHATAQAEVAAATTAWVEALNSRDPAKITANYPTPDSIAAYFASAPSRPTVRVKLGEHFIRVYGAR